MEGSGKGVLKLHYSGTKQAFCYSSQESGQGEQAQMCEIGFQVKLEASTKQLHVSTNARGEKSLNFTQTAITGQHGSVSL